MRGAKAEAFVVLSLRLLAVSFAVVGLLFIAVPNGVLDTISDLGDSFEREGDDHREKRDDADPAAHGRSIRARSSDAAGQQKRPRVTTPPGERCHCCEASAQRQRRVPRFVMALERLASGGQTSGAGEDQPLHPQGVHLWADGPERLRIKNRRISESRIGKSPNQESDFFRFKKRRFSGSKIGEKPNP